MKQLICFSLILSFPFVHSYSAEKASTSQLAVQKSTALPAHLTTRIQWTTFPQPQYNHDDLKGQNRAAILRIYADETGKITQASVQESTGLKNLDEVLLQAVRQAHVQPYKVEDTTLPIIGYQTFSLNLEQDPSECNYSFNSKNWMAQQQQQKVKFSYKTQPQLELNRDDLNQHDRKIKFSFKVDKHGAVKKVKINQGSGIYALDQNIVQAISKSQITVKRTASTLWLYKKSSFKDEIQFKLNQCS
ncbi:TonB family protein [Acinetobacter tibetensis]|uniref:Energy transducer TonB n=1 Tax=Acinetobacter tibetensis TaxID=2943497 RepID=A0AAE9LSJ6_9GAMM|nr:TonB family protein [Acinetobacter tibetensis]USE83801.1 energy transducer TonB [Acinetobacter tibetensis]